MLGLSGGVDSIVLLDVLAASARRRCAFELDALHVNHQLSPNADAWARVLRAARLGRSACPAASSRSTCARGNSLERAAREARYAALRSDTRRLHRARAQPRRPGRDRAPAAAARRRREGPRRDAARARPMTRLPRASGRPTADPAAAARRAARRHRTLREAQRARRGSRTRATTNRATRATGCAARCCRARASVFRRARRRSRARREHRRSGRAARRSRAHRCRCEPRTRTALRLEVVARALAAAREEPAALPHRLAEAGACRDADRLEEALRQATRAPPRCRRVASISARASCAVTRMRCISLPKQAAADALPSLTWHGEANARRCRDGACSR